VKREVLKYIAITLQYILSRTHGLLGLGSVSRSRSQVNVQTKVQNNKTRKSWRWHTVAGHRKSTLDIRQ